MHGSPSFAQARLICVALLGGMTMFTAVVAFVLQGNDGKGMGPEPMPVLDTVAIVLGVTTAIGAFVLRAALSPKDDERDPARRAMARFRAMLVPVAVLEGGCLFAVTVWLINGTAVPALVVALVLLAVAITMVPLSDPDAGAR